MATDFNAAEETSLRDTLDAAFEEHSDNNDEPPSQGKPDELKSGDEHRASPDAAQAQAQAAGEDARARDERGRFAPKGEQAPAAAAPDAAVAQAAAQAAVKPTTAPQPPGTELKAPASWRPEAREKWAGADPLVKQEAHRREMEYQQTLQQTAGLRQFVSQFERTVAPYEMFFRDENVTPLQAIQNLMQAATTLRIGNTDAKAQLVANMIKQYGVDLSVLDNTLYSMRQNGGLPSPQQAQLRDPRMDAFLAQQGTIQRQLEQAQDNEIRGSLDSFAEKHEFYKDVCDLMADIVELRARQGQPIELDKAYERACQMHEGVSTILAQRAAAAKASDSKAAVLRARRAAVSVKGDPALNDGATVPKDDSIRASIEAAMESHQRI